MDGHREALIEAFVAALRRQDPESVLDVGAGAGEVLSKLALASIPAVGIEPDDTARAKAHKGGLVVHAGHGEKLPFDDGAFDWVLLRHVLHHMKHPEKVLAEARRVTRRGLVIAEPYFDRSIASQLVSESAERWGREIEKRAGRFHRMGLNAGEVCAALGDLDASWSLEISTFLPMQARNLDAFFAEHDVLCREGILDDSLEKERLYLSWRGRAGYVSRPGTLILVARRG